MQAVLAPTQVHIPEPFLGAVGHYFEQENVTKLKYEQVNELKVDLCNVALNMCDGNKTKACKMLGISRATLIEILTRAEK